MNETRRTFFFISLRRPDSPVIAAAADPSGRFSISPQMEKDATFVFQNCTRHAWNHVSH